MRRFSSLALVCTVFSFFACSCSSEAEEAGSSEQSRNPAGALSNVVGDAEALARQGQARANLADALAGTLTGDEFEVDFSKLDVEPIAKALVALRAVIDGVRGEELAEASESKINRIKEYELRPGVFGLWESSGAKEQSQQRSEGDMQFRMAYQAFKLQLFAQVRDEAVALHEAIDRLRERDEDAWAACRGWMTKLEQFVPVQ